MKPTIEPYGGISHLEGFFHLVESLVITGMSYGRLVGIIEILEDRNREIFGRNEDECRATKRKHEIREIVLWERLKSRLENLDSQVEPGEIKKLIRELESHGIFQGRIKQHYRKYLFGATYSRQFRNKGSYITNRDLLVKQKNKTRELIDRELNKLFSPEPWETEPTESVSRQNSGGQ